MSEETILPEVLEKPIEKTEEPKPVEDPVVSMQKQIDEMKDKYLRALADGENARKRLAKEKQEIVCFAIENAIGEFLPAIDHFEKALRMSDSATGDVKNWAIGFQMILSQFKEVLQNYGINAFHSEGKLFDPHCHEAVEIMETEDVPEGTILEEFTKGYQSASRTIRPARVKVARLPRKAEPAPEPAETVESQN
jgi:molecular chaperone GrpE